MGEHAGAIAGCLENYLRSMIPRRSDLVRVIYIIGTGWSTISPVSGSL